MLSALFKPGWQSDSVEKRLQAIAKMDLADAASQTVLENLAANDSDLSVRCSALAAMSRPSALLHISQTHEDTETCEYAKAAFIALIGPKSSLTESELNTLGAEHPSSKVLLTQHCSYSSLRHAFLAEIPELDQAELIADVEYADTRKLIAERLVSQTSLEIARHNIKGRDKTAEKIIRLKLERIRADLKQEQENQAAADSLCEKIEFIANHAEWRTEFKSRFLSYETDWQGLNFTPSATAQQRYATAYEKAKVKVVQQVATETAQQAQEKLAVNLVKHCAELAHSPLMQISESTESLSELLSSSLSEWLKQTDIEPPNLAIADDFLVAQKALTSVIALGVAATEPSNIAALEKAHKQVYWPKQYPDLKALGEAEDAIGELKLQKKQVKQSEKEKLDNLHKRINRLLGSTKRGDVKLAQKELAATTKIAGYFGGKDKVALDERLAQATLSVEKMADWQAFATEPKFIELSEAMEKLGTSTAHPDKLANKIKSLQERWKALGHSGVADKHWERFKTAADAAYEPCSIFFKQRRETQRENLKKREPLIDRMQALLKNTPWSEEPDYKNVESELRSISNDWQKIKDVEHGPGQKQWEKLSAVRANIYEHLDIVYDKNIELKHQIISQVEALLTSDVGEQAIDKLQLFQNRWKQVGVTRRKQDQAAWKKFKHASDNVYAKIQGVRHEKRAEENTQLQGYRDIIKQIQQVAKSAADISQADASIDTLRADYQALPPLPKTLPEKLVKGLDADFQRAVSAYDKTREKLVLAEKLKTIDKLAEKAALCAQLEQLANDASPDKIETIKTEIAAVQLNDKTLEKRFEQRLAAATNTDRQKANEARRRLCIDLEILLGEESPAEDKNLRMQIQLEQMKKQGIGHGQAENKDRLSELKLDWLCLPGAEPEIQTQLDHRFQALVSKNH